MARTERNNGKQVSVRYNKITVDGQLWKWNNATRKLEEQETKN